MQFLRKAFFVATLFQIQTCQPGSVKQSTLTYNVAVILSCWQVHGDSSCDASIYGKEFVFGFIDLQMYPSYRTQEDPTLSILIDSHYSTHVDLELPSTSSASKTPVMVSQQFYVYREKSITVNASFINRYQDTTSGGAIRLTADSPVSVRTIYQTSKCIVTSPILPISALGQEYALPSYQPNSFTGSRNELMIVAVNDSTEVRMNGFETGSIVQQLNKNEVYVYQRFRDISSTHITSNYPVAVFSSVTKGDYLSASSHYQTNVQDILMQAFPASKTGTRFIVPSLELGPTVKNYILRIFAFASNAYVQIYHSSTQRAQHIYKNIHYDEIVRGSTTVEVFSDMPILVVQIPLTSSGAALCMTYIPAVGQYLTEYVLGHTGGMEYYTFIVRSDESTGILVDSKPVIHNPEQVAHSTPLGNYTVLTMPLTSSTRKLITHAGNIPFGMLVYGGKNDQSDVVLQYGYPAGLQFTKVAGCPSTTDPSSAFVGKK